VAAIRGAQRGLKTICIDKGKAPGGTCLHWGCVPSQALLRPVVQYKTAVEKFGKYGITYDNVSFDFAQMMKRKNEIIFGLTKGIEALFCKYGVKYVKGIASFGDTTAKLLEIKLPNNETQYLTAKNIIIASGSRSRKLSPLQIDEKTILSSAGGLTLKEIPKKLIIIGAGAIGMEFGCIYKGLGAEVTLVEYQNNIAPFCDKEVSVYMEKLFEKDGFKIYKGKDVIGCKVIENKAEITICDRRNPESITKLEADKVLVAIGRKPYTRDLGIEKIGFEMDKLGRFIINENLEVFFYS